MFLTGGLNVVGALLKTGVVPMSAVSSYGAAVVAVVVVDDDVELL